MYKWRKWQPVWDIVEQLLITKIKERSWEYQQSYSTLCLYAELFAQIYQMSLSDRKGFVMDENISKVVKLAEDLFKIKGDRTIRLYDEFLRFVDSCLIRPSKHFRFV